MAVNFPADELGSARFTRSAFLLGSVGLAASLAGFRAGRGLAALSAAAAVDAGTWIPWQTAHLLTRAQFRNKHEELARSGYRLMRISGYQTADGFRLAAIWALTGGSGQIVEIGLSKSNMKDSNSTHESQGYHLRAIDGVSLAGVAAYSGIWEPATDRTPKLHLGMTAADCGDKLTSLRDKGFGILNVSGFELNGEARFAGLWHKDAPVSAVAEIEMSEGELRETDHANAAQGLALIDVTAYHVGGQTRYSAIWDDTGEIEFDLAEDASTLDEGIDGHR